jgi:hypothetical protein
VVAVNALMEKIDRERERERESQHEEAYNNTATTKESINGIQPTNHKRCTLSSSRVRGVSFALKLLHVRVGSRYLSTYNTRCTSSYKILSLLYLFSSFFF